MSATAFLPPPALVVVHRDSIVRQAKLLVKWAMQERKAGDLSAYHAFILGAKGAAMPLRSPRFPRVNDTRIPPVTTQPGAEGAQPVEATSQPQDQAPGLLSGA